MQTTASLDGVSYENPVTCDFGPVLVDCRVALKDVDFIITDLDAGKMQLVDYEFSSLRGNFPREKELAYGESFAVKPGQQLRFFAVLSESRCPSDVVCITAGEVTVILRIIETLESGNTLRTDFGLTLLGTDISYFEYKEIYYRLVDVAPYPIAIGPADEEDYVITLEYQSVPFKY